MKRLLVSLALTAAALVLLAPPAMAGDWGTVCKNFSGPDGDGGANVRICIMVDLATFSNNLRAKLVIENNGTKPHEVHASYLKLIKNGVTHINSGPFIRSASAGVNQIVVTEWKLGISGGPWWSRTRVWVCWPSFAGDPCGSIVIWNSGSFTLP